MKPLQVVLASLVVSFFFVGPAHTGDDPGKSPEDVFKAFASALKKEDLKVAMSHLTRDSQSLIAGSIWLSAPLAKRVIGIDIAARGLRGPKREEALGRIAAVDEVLKRHGLSDDVMWKILEKENKASTVDWYDLATFVTLGEFIKDKPAFVADYLKKTANTSAKENWFNEIREAKVKEVKIGGQQAKGQAKFPGATSFAVAGTIYFRLEGAVWKIDLLETYRNWPPLPASPQAQPPTTEAQTPALDQQSRPRLFPRRCPDYGRPPR